MFSEFVPQVKYIAFLPFFLPALKMNGLKILRHEESNFLLFLCKLAMNENPDTDWGEQMSINDEKRVLN